MTHLSTIVAALLLALPALASGQPTKPPALKAVRLAAPLMVDGSLDEECYETNPPFSDFVQQEPVDGAPATERTDFWVFFDDQNVYISARMWDSHPERIMGNEMRRDGSNMSQNDTIAIAIDTFHDQRTGFLFITNPLGAMQEGLITGEKDYNGNWNGIWNPRSHRFAQGWATEIAIPFKSLRYGGSTDQVWGINVRRVVRCKNEVTHLAPVPPSFALMGIMRLAEAATLTGIQVPSSSSRFEVKPYGITRLSTDRVRQPAIDNELKGDVGADAKVGVTRGLTADFTYNTDFAQVEDDQQQVNLTRFGLFFPEKREFFLEGQGLFLFGGVGDDTPSLFFSRQIGLAGNQPVPIKGGGRLTGKVGRTSIGLLDIQTDAGENGLGEPTNFGVVRLRQDVLNRSSIGMIATRRAPDGRGANVVGGVDGNFVFGMTTITTYFAKTQTPGLDTRDHSYLGRMEYNADRYGATLQHLVVAPNFNPEIGFLRRRNFRKNYLQLRFSPRPRHLPGVRKLSYIGAVDYITNFDRRLESRSVGGTFTADFNNSDQLSATTQRNFEALPSPFTIARGVTIPAGPYPFTTTTLAYTAGATHRVLGTVTVNTGTFYEGSRNGVALTGRVALSPRAAFEPTISRDWVDLPWGRFHTDLASVRGLYTISPRAGLSALLQYASALGTFSSNVRFQWEYRPGSDLFVVYGDGRNTLDPAAGNSLLNRSFVVKVTRLMRF